MKLEIKKDMDGKNITCEASHPTYSAPVKTVIMLKVLYKPELTITQEPAEIKEGDTVTIKCVSTSNPPKVMFKWYIDDVIEYESVKDEDPDDQTSALELTGIDKSKNGQKIKCWASNKIQNKPYETEAVHTLNINCKVI